MKLLVKHHICSWLVVNQDERCYRSQKLLARIFFARNLKDCKKRTQESYVGDSKETSFGMEGVLGKERSKDKERQ